jgi:hypothetical protein
MFSVLGVVEFVFTLDAREIQKNGGYHYSASRAFSDLSGAPGRLKAQMSMVHSPSWTQTETNKIK